ncbi:single-stranded DNA-binding protein [Arthrobacter yangruifuii]|uniref:Single-stranded DNA-binding protein n=1 Tax=Arthrobacter yangruifuii TaxID=2606616 RepID=A0A5N6MQU1_9MICC|nr:single-stranded DNA-binding protein [Arthrobacter yangruifuii]KAD4007227.1 single-stranded DNA-binding protein [Arthrobacter yangruifuii]
MSDTITLRGYVATDLRRNTTDNGLAVASFRMCTTERRYDRDTGGWLDGQTNWYAVSLFRQLATNAAFSIHKGDRVVVTGRLRLRQWTTEDGRSGTSADIDADTVGHDLMWGTASFRRTASTGTDASLGGDRADGGVGAETGTGSGLGGDPDLEESLGRLDPLTGELLDPVPEDGGSAEGGSTDGGSTDGEAMAAEPTREKAGAPF